MLRRCCSCLLLLACFVGPPVLRAIPIESEAPIIEESITTTLSSAFEYQSPDSELSLHNAVLGVFSRALVRNSELVREINDKEEGKFSLRRHLAIGDFDEFNAIFKGAVIRLPEAQVKNKVGLWTLTLDIWDLMCTNMQVGDILISYKRNSNQKLAMTLDVVDLDMNCRMDYRYQYFPVKGQGVATAVTNNNDATVTLAFASPNFGTSPPTSATIENCETNLNVDDIEFDGGIVAAILDVFQGSISNVVETEVANVACSELGSLATDLVTDFLQMADDVLQDYLGPLYKAEPLQAEVDLLLSPPSDKTLVNLQDKEGNFGSVIHFILDQLDAFLGVEVDDLEGPTDNGRDLGVNVFLRENLLDQDRAFTLDMVELFPNGTVLFDGHDKLTQTTIELESVRVFGIDTFTKFYPLVDLGNYTLSNELALDFLTFELDVKLTIRPSTLPDSVIEQPSADKIVETIRIEFGVDKIDTVIAVLLAIDQDELTGMPLGGLLDTSGILPCFLSTIHELKFTELAVTIENVRTPTLDDFLSAGIDRVLSTAAEALFSMYETVLLKALPNMVGISGLDMINKEVLNKYLEDPANSVCDRPQENTGTVDFRDLLLSPEVAATAGATGTSPYGNVLASVMNLLQEEFLSLDDDGLPKLNSMVIRPLTKSQSGQEGRIQLSSVLFDVVKEVDTLIGSAFTERFQIKMSDLRLDNLDILTEPVSLLQATTDPHKLTNMLNMGPVAGRPLNATARFLWALDGDSPLNMRNEMDLSISVPSSVIWADLVALIDANKLMQFPLEGVLDYNCWLSTISGPELDENGNYVEPRGDPSLGLSTFFVQMLDLDVGFDCVDCTSPGVIIIPDLIDSLKQSGAIPMLRDRAENFVAEIAEGEWLQLTVDRLLNDASRLCKHSPSFVEGAVASDYGGLGFPDLSRESLETIAFAGVSGAPIALFVFAESQILTPAEPADPLAAQSSLVVPSDTTLVDFTDLGGSVGSWAENLLEQAKELISDAMGTGTDSDGSFDLKATIQDLLLDDEGVLRITFDDLVLDDIGIILGLSEIRITGLDSISRMDVLDAIAPQTLQNVAVIDKLGVDVVVDLGAEGANPEEMIVAFGFNNVKLDLALLLALDLDRFSSVQLGSLLHMKQILPCFLSTLMDIDISQLVVTVDSVDTPKVNGFLPDSLLSTLTTSINDIFEARGTTMVAAMPKISNVFARGLLNNILKAYVNADKSTVCPPMVTTSTKSGLSAFMDFRDLLLPEDKSRELGGSGEGQYGDLIRTLLGFVKDEIMKMDSAGLSSLNDILIRPLTESVSDTPGAILIEGDLFSNDVNLGVGGLNARIELRAYDARVENLDSLGAPLQLLEPVLNEASILNNTATMGIGNPLRFSVRFVFALQGDDDMQVRNEVDISIDMEAATVVLGALLKIAEEPFLAFPLGDATNFNCWLATIPAPVLNSQGIRVGGEPVVAVTDLALSMARLGLNISCVSCTSPDLIELSTILASPEAKEDATEVGNMLLDFATRLFDGNFLQIQIDRLLSDAAVRCPHNAAYNPSAPQVVYEPFEPVNSEGSSIDFLIAIVVSMGCLFVFAMMVYFVVRFIVRRRHRKWLRTLANDNIVALYREQKREADISHETKSMFTSPVIPVYVRILMPIVILGNIGFFLSGHLSLGASVNIEADMFGERFTIEKFFEFSMARSTVDIWKAGGKELAILILLFSGVWPYTKQIITLVLWFLPPKIMSVTRRGSVFYWLDTLAKWSMVDIFALVISLASFRVSIESPDVAFLTDGFYSLDLMVVPMWGLYANMIAQLISQVSSHFIIYYHSRVVEKARNDYDNAHSSPKTVVGDDLESNRSGSETNSSMSHSHSTEEIVDERRDQLYHHAFMRSHRRETDKLMIRRGINAFLVVASIAIVFLVAFGCSRPSFSVEVLGIIGVAVESGQNFKKAVTDYSVFDIVSLLMEQARFLDSVGDYFGLGTLSVLVIFSILVVPLVQTVILLRQWFAPMTRARRAKLYVVVEVLQAWQYIEVYIIAVVVSAWQLGPVSQFMINSYCEDLEATFATLVYYGIIKPRDAQCFMVEASVESAAYMLIAAAILLALLNTFIMKAIEQYQRDTDESLLRFEAEEPKVLSEASSEMNTEEDIFEMMDKIHPVQVMFTDMFRWLLRREDSFVTASMKRGLDGDAKLGVNKGFPHVDPDQQLVDGGVPVILVYPERSVTSETRQSSDESSLVVANTSALTEEDAFEDEHDEVHPKAVSFEEDLMQHEEDILPELPADQYAQANNGGAAIVLASPERSGPDVVSDDDNSESESTDPLDDKDATPLVGPPSEDDSSAVSGEDAALNTTLPVDDALLSAIGSPEDDPFYEEGFDEDSPMSAAEVAVGVQDKNDTNQIEMKDETSPESEWTCPSCSYMNADGRCTACALCGLTRHAAAESCTDAESLSTIEESSVYTSS